MALLISNHARPRLRLEQESWFTPGKVRLPDVRAARLLAWRVNESLESSRKATAGASAGSIRALDLIEEALQRLARHHLETRNPSLLARSLVRLEENLGKPSLERTLRAFAGEYLGDASLSQEAILLDLLILWVLRDNPAARPIHEVLHDSPLLVDRDFRRTVDGLTGDLELEELGDGGGHERLLDLLLAPQRASPDSLLGQLQFLLRRWSDLLADHAGELQAGLDLFAEELAPRFQGGRGPAEAPALVFDDDPVRYSSDRNWMPSLVLLAKNVYVWLDQLTRQNGRTLRHLDEIPDTELERLAAHGVTGLWLIGVWERSVASQRVKQMCGNPEAVASAYSLRRYQIAEELGGELAFQRLKKRAWEHGIRLAADMVPNHMGIDSDWVLEHPEWFLGDSRSPFPSYSFEGPDFSPDPAVGIYLEDHYFDRSDAAVVFKRVDRATGSERFIYHGNDGTSMPWNDTAQLDYLDPRVREAVVATILDVAQRFPVIRFDAAMTLAKRHYQRLWFPEPGTAGAIPSRSEHGMSRDEFQRRMPEEFWREVVERVAREQPDTLLLAEAFWLMEGYFVRTLGMHRVYNSAFMNMLRDQENAKYRRLLKETLEFDPQILQRYVNFMSNPDEETAVEQFGKDDRYFGICVMMATLPGLPMFAHGQFEGFAEKYGMEYRRAYWNEQVDRDLMARHQHEIVPLLKRRHLFAGVDDFRLYDLVDANGAVNEDVFAYSNGIGDDRVLVVFNNRWQHAHGWVRDATPMRPAGTVGGDLLRQSLAEALEVEASARDFIACRDLIGGLEYLIDSRELVDRGWEVDLGAFHYRVLAGFRRLHDADSGLWARLAERLAGAGVDDLIRARRGLQLEPVRQMWNERLQPALERLHSRIEAGEEEASTEPSGLDEIAAAIESVAGAAATIDGSGTSEAGATVAEGGLQAFVETMTRRQEGVVTPDRELAAAGLVWIALRRVSEALGNGFTASSLLEEWSLRPEATRALAELGVAPESTSRLLAAIACGIDLGWGRESMEAPHADTLLADLLSDEPTRRALQVHSFQGVEYLNRESLETLLRWRGLLDLWARSEQRSRQGFDSEAALEAWRDVLEHIESAAEEVGYRTDRLRQRLAEVSSRTSR